MRIQVNIILSFKINWFGSNSKAVRFHVNLVFFFPVWCVCCGLCHRCNKELWLFYFIFLRTTWKPLSHPLINKLTTNEAMNICSVIQVNYLSHWESRCPTNRRIEQIVLLQHVPFLRGSTSGTEDLFLNEWRWNDQNVRGMFLLAFSLELIPLEFEGLSRAVLDATIGSE